MSSQPLFDARPVVGPVLIGALLGWGLFGTLLVQYGWYLYTAHDRAAIRLFVSCIVFFEALQTISSTDCAWRLMVSGRGHPEVLPTPTWSIATVPVLTGIISTGVQLFFLWRILTLSKWRIVAALLTIITLAQGACGFVVGIKFATVQSLNNSAIYPYIITWLGGSAICDVLTSLALVCFCHKATRNIGRLGPTATLLTQISLLSIETGCLTSAVSITDLALALIYGGTNIHLAPCLLITKCFTNALLLSLNARPLLAHRRDQAITLYASPGVSQQATKIALHSETQEGDQKVEV